MVRAADVRVLMLDCAGFVGSHVVGRLLDQSDVEVICTATDHRPVSRYLSHERLTFYGGELPPDADLVERLVARSDVTVNLIATADARHHRDDVNAILDVDLPASLAPARACAEHGARFVQISSGDVYSGFGAAPPPVGSAAAATSRHAAPLQGGTPVDACALYASGKRLLELGVQTSGNMLGLDYTLLRLFNPVGPGCDALVDWCPRHPAPFFAQLVRGIVHGSHMEFPIDPEDVYTYLHVDDAVDCIVDVILHPRPGAQRQLYNVGSPDNAITPAALAQRLFALHAGRLGTPSRATVTWVPTSRPVPGPVEQVPDIAQTIDALGWRPERSLDEILDGALDGMLARRWESGRR